MRFEENKYYKHTTGIMIKTLCKAETTMWGKVLVAERAGLRHHDITPVGHNSDDYAENWEEITEKEWMGDFK